MVVFFVVFTVVSVHAFTTVMTKQAKDEMIGQVELVETMYDAMAPGEFDVKMLEKGKYQILKGSHDITNENEVLEHISSSQEIQVSIFCQNVRVLTTMKNHQGESYRNSKVAKVVEKEVLDTGKAKFYDDVTIDGEEYFAYYKPIIRKDGIIFGMIGVSRPAQDIYRGVWRAVLPLILVCLVAAILICLIEVHYSKKLIGKIGQIRQFMNRISKGDFEAEMPEDLRQRSDELGDLAKSGTAMKEELKKLVETDPLTQLHNRRYGDQKLHQAQSIFKTTSFCIGIADIDFFKKINDTYGHDAGDVVLHQVASLLQRTMIGKGFAARWGGEEFLLVFDKCSLLEAKDIMEAMFEVLRNMEISYGNEAIKVTMSCGLTQTKAGEKSDDILKRADEYLYYCKSNGRNQIYIGEEV